MKLSQKLLHKISDHFEVRTDAVHFLPKLQSHRGFRNTPNALREGQDISLREGQDISLRENTLASIQKAHELGYLMVEFDVRLTKDHHVILYHDDNIEGKLISHLTLSEVQLRQEVDLLDDVFGWYAHKQIDHFKFNVEIKSKSTHGQLEKQVFRLIQKFGLQKNILISSFNPFSLMYFRLFDPTIFRSLLLTFSNESGNNFVIKNMMLNVFARPNALHLNHEDWDSQKFNKITEKNVPIVLWTCNDLNLIQKYFAEGIVGVISDTITPNHIS
jgi:glycerophosphoryl diester phosphodiesterase